MADTNDDDMLGIPSQRLNRGPQNESGTGDGGRKSDEKEKREEVKSDYGGGMKKRENSGQVDGNNSCDKTDFSKETPEAASGENQTPSEAPDEVAHRDKETVSGKDKENEQPAVNKGNDSESEEQLQVDEGQNGHEQEKGEHERLGLPAQRCSEDGDVKGRDSQTQQTAEDAGTQPKQENEKGSKECDGAPLSAGNKNGDKTDDKTETSGYPYTGVPRQATQGSEPLTAEEDEHLAKQREQQRIDEREETFENKTEKMKTRFQLPSFLWHPVIISALIIGLGLLGLFVIAQTSSIVVTISNMPVMSAYIIAGALLILLGAILYTVVRLGMAYMRFRESPTLQLQALAKLSERRNLRKQVGDRRRQAQEELRDYLEDYPSRDELGKRFKEWEINDSKMLDNLMNARNRLLDERNRKASDEWLKNFEKRFQKPLDELADRRITKWAKRVGVKTAAVPYPLVDTMIVFYSSSQLLSDLCQIYNLRFGTWNTAIILVYVAWITLIAGGVGELEDEIEEGVDWVVDNMPTGAVKEGIRDVPGLGKLFSKLTSGAVNALLIRRMGKKCKQLLRPVNSN